MRHHRPGSCGRLLAGVLGHSRIDREFQTLTLGYVVNGLMTVFDVVELAEVIPELRPLKLSDLLAARFSADVVDRILFVLRREWTSTAAMTVAWLLHYKAGPRRRRLFNSLVVGEGVPLFLPVVPGATG